MSILHFLLTFAILVGALAKEIEIDLEIAWPSGIYVDAVTDPATGDIFRFGRLRQSTVGLRPHYETISVVENVLSVRETQDLIRAAEIYAKEFGWSKGRHVDYSIRPTKDHSIDTILNKTEVSILKTKLADTIFPKFKRQYGLRPSLLRIEDLFITKYDSVSKENSLAPHIDKNPWSFVVALNDDFKGGGTYFLRQQRVWNVPIGAAVVFHGYQMHGAYKIESGTRYILAGFCEYGNNTDEFFLTQYDAKYDGNAAAAGFRTGDLIIGLERCKFERKTPPAVAEAQCSSEGNQEELVSREMVPITRTMTDKEWTELAQSCEQLSPSTKSKMRVRRYVPDEIAPLNSFEVSTEL